MTEEEELTFPFREKAVTIQGKEFVFRELSVLENDECADMARDPETREINARTMTRLMIIKSVVTPTLSPKSLAQLPQSVYARIYTEADLINSRQPDDEAEVTVGEAPND